MSRLVVVSNRVAPLAEGKPATGGLAVAVDEALRAVGGLWFGWSGQVTFEPQKSVRIAEHDNVTLATIDLSRKDHEEYYRGYSNSTLWPLCHYRAILLEQKRRYYEGYLRVNAFFAAKLAPLVGKDDLIWVHDYHLFPLAQELRRAGLKNRIGFFLHIPFPPPDVFRACTEHMALIRNLADYSLIGFQTENDIRNFFAYVVNVAGGRVSGRTVEVFGRRFTADVFPIGVYPDELAETAARVSRSRQIRTFVRSLDERDLIIGVDRLDYAKGLEQRFAGYEQFLADVPERRGHVTFMQIAPTSRTEVQTYREIRHRLETQAGHINGRFADSDWVPLRYLNKSYDRTMLMGFFRSARACLTTPLRDGMNLVAKEYVAAQDPRAPGMLVLSEFAGAAAELDAAVLINPYDTGSIAEGIHRALEMNVEERRERWQAMMTILKRNNLGAWRNRFLRTLERTPLEATAKTTGGGSVSAA